MYQSLRIYLALAVFLLFVGSDVFAQQRGQGNGQNDSRNRAKNAERNSMVKNNRWFFGLNPGLSISTNSTFISINPVVGYKVSNTVSVGGGPFYEYFKVRNSGIERGSNSKGIRAFSSVAVSQNIFAYAEYEFNNQYNPISDKHTNINRIPVGGGYRQALGGNTYLNAFLLYDLLYPSNKDNPNYFYNTGLIYRIGITTGFGRFGNASIGM